MANIKIAAEVHQNAQKFMKLFLTVHSPHGLTATPHFNQFDLRTVEHLMDATSLTPSEIVTHLATPIRWTCDGKYAPTAEQAIELAFKSRTQKRNQNAAATEKAVANGWPKLVGSPKQVTWAETIRAEHSRKVPDSAYLKSNKAAAWWIQNQKVI